jgi:isocitrate/isopropylmalate dehydrogenase
LIKIIIEGSGFALRAFLYPYALRRLGLFFPLTPTLIIYSTKIIPESPGIGNDILSIATKGEQCLTYRQEFHYPVNIREKELRLRRRYRDKTPIYAKGGNNTLIFKMSQTFLPVPRNYSIALIPGDGIGPEVIEAGVEVVKALSEALGTFSVEFENYNWGSDLYKKTGKYIPDGGLDKLKKHDAILFGAVGAPGKYSSIDRSSTLFVLSCLSYRFPFLYNDRREILYSNSVTDSVSKININLHVLDVPDHISLWGLRLAICQPFQQYANVRPTRVLRGTQSPLRNCKRGDLDWVIIRENSEGEYAGHGGRSHVGNAWETATEVSIFTRHGVTRLIRFAFETAQKRPRKLLTVVTKSNAQRNGMVLWDEIANEVAKEFPDVIVDKMLVDAMTTRMVLKPESLDTIVATNLVSKPNGPQ